MATITYRPLETPADLDRVIDLELRVWGMDIRDAVPMNLMRAFALHGGLVGGAFMGDRLVGATIAFPALAGGRRVLWSHTAGVEPDVQGQGIGLGLKLAQRAWALEHGYAEIRWTFDPLQRGNAHFNLARLGAAAVAYHEDYYGEMTDAINRGAGSDRLEAVWKLKDRRVAALAEGRARERDRRGWTADEALVLLAHDGQPHVAPALLGAPRLYVEIPRDRRALRAEQLIRWREALRAGLARALAEGYTAVDFVDDGARSAYALRGAQAWYLYVLECADGTLYTGITPDVPRRLALHQAGRGAAYTRSRRPVTLRGAWRFPGKVAALKAEAAFKTLGRDAKRRHLARGLAYAGAPFVHIDTESL